MDFGSTSNFKTAHQTQSPCTVILTSGNGEHFTFFLLVAKALKGKRGRVAQLHTRDHYMGIFLLYYDDEVDGDQTHT